MTFAPIFTALAPARAPVSLYIYIYIQHHTAYIAGDDSARAQLYCSRSLNYTPDNSGYAVCIFIAVRYA